MESDAAALKWNGLTVDENFRLLRTRDPVLIASLVLQGLLNVARDRGTGKLQIELVQGSVTTGSNLDAVAVGVFDKIPLGGAGAALDLAIGGRASVERRADADQSGVPEVDADWLYLARSDRWSVAGLAAVEQGLRNGQQSRDGFQRLGVVVLVVRCPRTLSWRAMLRVC
jgi:hypothetical protein